MKKHPKTAGILRKALNDKVMTKRTANWDEVLNKLENECTYRASEDLKRIIDAVEPKNLDFVLSSLNIPIPEPNNDIQKHEPSESINTFFVPLTKSPIQTGAPIDKSLPDEKYESFRKTVCNTIYQRIARISLPSPYKVELSEESSESDVESDKVSLSSAQATSSVDLDVNPPTPPKGPPKVVLEDLRSPYQKFFSYSKHELEAHIDSHKKEQVYSHKDKIFMDFLEFLNSPEIQLESDNITLDSLRTLFDIQIQNPAAQAFATDLTELSKIPKEIVDLYDDPQSSGRAFLHRQILWDILYEKGEEKSIAFGKSVDKPRLSWKNDTKRRWLISDEIPWDLVSGRDLWKDLLNSEILEGFAKWLIANPQYDRPKYLEKIGYFKGIEQDSAKEDPVKLSLKKKRCGEAFYTLANNMKHFVGDNELSYLPRLDELKDALQNSTQNPGGRNN